MHALSLQWALLESIKIASTLTCFSVIILPSSTSVQFIENAIDTYMQHTSSILVYPHTQKPCNLQTKTKYTCECMQLSLLWDALLSSLSDTYFGECLRYYCYPHWAIHIFERVHAPLIWMRDTETRLHVLCALSDSYFWESACTFNLNERHRDTSPCAVRFTLKKRKCYPHVPFLIWRECMQLWVYWETLLSTLCSCAILNLERVHAALT